MNEEIRLWEAQEGPVIPASATTGAEIIQYAKQLSRRDVQQLKEALKSDSYEMAAAFVWTKTMSALKRQLAGLGPEFIGEMLGRADMTAASPTEQSLTDYEAIRLAEDLGIVTNTNALRLRHSLETIAHFNGRHEDDDEEEMTKEEAILTLRACVQGILGHSRVAVAMQFADFRHALEARVFGEDDEEMAHLAASPYFFQKTTLNVLLGQLKAAKGAQLDNILANVNVVLPLIWERLRKPEKWQTGFAYAELVAGGKENVISGLRKALVKVHGFDFVPENLRSTTFMNAAQKVLEAHDGFSNFHNEPAPMNRLATLGSSIPMPAFKICLTATLCVRLGNYYGLSWSAQEGAIAVLRTLSRDRWEYFVVECLPADRRVLEKLLDSKPRHQWIDVVRTFELAKIVVHSRRLRLLLNASDAGSEQGIEAAARELIGAMGYKQ